MLLVVCVVLGLLVPVAWPVIPFGVVLYLLLKWADSGVEQAQAAILAGDRSDGAYMRHWLALALFAAVGLGGVFLLSVAGGVL